MASLRDQLQPTVDHAIALHQSGRVAEAERIYRQVLQQDPDNPDALHLMGLIAHHAGQYPPAAALMQRAIASQPDVGLYHVNLAKVFRASGRFDEGVVSARRGAQLWPRFTEAYVELSACLRATGAYAEAEAAARQAVNLGPNHPEALSVLASSMSHGDKHEEALALYEAILRVRPGWHEAIGNLGEAQRKLGRYDEAEKNLREAIRLAPSVGESHFNLGLALLVRGQFEEGWREYEWRWKQVGVHMRPFTQATWDGSNLNGKSIFLFAEQGIGDTIQMLRYVPLLRDRGAGRVIVECADTLVDVAKTVDGVSEVVVRNTAPPPFDVQCALMSLPYRFGTTLATIPNRVPYVKADPQREARWRDELKPRSDQFSVGLVWAGSPAHRNDANRSCRFADFAPLFEISNLRFFSLQLGPARDQLSQIEDPTPSIRTYSDTAALLTQLDLLICVDTSVAHLAGALARRVWTIHPHVPDFRWLLDRSDSPWYPTMKIFRQPRAGDWSSVMQTVARELHDRARAKPIT